MSGGRPLVAIVGRPQVGKSTLFNRLIGRRQAIVAEEPGTTRDRLYAEVAWDGREFTLVDTGGLVPWAEDEMTVEVGRQVEIAIAEAQSILFVVDAKQGLVGAEEEIAQRLRRGAKPVLVVVNKSEGKEPAQAGAEFYRLGLGTPHPVSALHGTGTGDLMDALVATLPPAAQAGATGVVAQEPTRVAIVGRPNVGKSSLLNAFLGENRAIVNELPGTTRDALDTPLTWENERVMLIDTAGLRQRGRVATQLEHYSVLRALRAIERSDVVVLLLDAGQGLVAQDAHIGGYVADRGRGIVLVVNKWDLVPPQIRDQVRAQYRSSLQQLFRFAPYAPVYFVSALTAEGTAQVLRAALNVERERRREVAADELKQWLREATARHSPPASKGRAVRFFDVSQTGSSPPTISLAVSDPQGVHFSYQRYLENALRQAFGFSGTPVRLIFRKGTASARRRPS